MPKLSIVVPTRDRSDTLFHTIRTIVEQDYSDCEIIISDNASEDNTKEVVDSFTDHRIRYINTGKRVSMADNWEFALGHVQGEYVTYIGDDDGFLPGALSLAMAILERNDVDALIWKKIEYCWPDYIDENYRNWISLKTNIKYLQIADGHKQINKVASFLECYTKLPCLYNGIVRTILIDKVKTASINGVFFNSISPDVYSGIALSYLARNYLLSSRPFSVNGASRHSNGTSCTRSRRKDVGTPAAKFLSELNRKYDHRILMGPSVEICVMGELLLAKKFLPGFCFPEPRWGKYVTSLIRSARNSLLSDEILQSAKHTSRELGLGIEVPSHVESIYQVQPSIGLHGDTFSFKVSEDIVSNVYDACRLVANILSEL